MGSSCCNPLPHALTRLQKFACLPCPQLLLQRSLSTERARAGLLSASPSAGSSGLAPAARTAAACLLVLLTCLLPGPALLAGSPRCCCCSVPSELSRCSGCAWSRRCMRGSGGSDGGGDCTPESEPRGSGWLSPAAASSSTSPCICCCCVLLLSCGPVLLPAEMLPSGRVKSPPRSMVGLCKLPLLMLVLLLPERPGLGVGDGSVLLLSCWRAHMDAYSPPAATSAA